MTSSASPAGRRTSEPLNATAGEPTLDTSRPFTRRALLEAKLDPRVLRGSSYRRLGRGVYVDRSTPDTSRLRVLAALACFDASAFASHVSAGRIYGLPLPTWPIEHVSVTRPGLRRRRVGVVCHVRESAEVALVHGVRVSSPGDLFVELATMLHLIDLVVVGDRMVKLGLLTTTALADHCRTTTQPGAAAARLAAAYVRARVDSPMETRLRLLLVLAGLPEPEINVTIRDATGMPVRRYDLSWPSVKVIVEYDGRHHVERQEQWEADLERREAIDDDAWRLLVIVSSGIYRSPDRTVERVWRLLRSRRLAGVPARPSDAWRPHFPSPTDRD